MSDILQKICDDTRRHVDGREVLRGGVGRTCWLEYGPHTRCPGRVRRPTFPELYDRPKVMFGMFTGVQILDITVTKRVTGQGIGLFSYRPCAFHDVENPMGESSILQFATWTSDTPLSLCDLS